MWLPGAIAIFGLTIITLTLWRRMLKGLPA